MDSPHPLASHGYDTPEHSLDGWSGDARVVDIYDGDSVHVVLNETGRFVRVKCRLSGIDTCEIRSRRAANKELAYAARDRLAALITGGSADSFQGASRKAVRKVLADRPAILRAQCGHADKYGRTLVKLFVRREDGASEGGEPDGAVSVGATLVEDGLAYRYHGGKRLSESEQIRELSRGGEA